MGDFGGVGLVDAEAGAGAGAVLLVPPGGADMRDWVDAGRGRGCMAVGGGGVDMCARQLFGLSAGCARDILSLVAFVSGQSLVGCAQSSP